MDLVDRLEALRKRAATQGAVVSPDALEQAEALAADASRDAEILLRANATALVVRFARELGALAHAVQACRELLASWPRIEPMLDEAGEETEQALVWALKHGARAALDIPEIPLASVEELIGALEVALARFGRQPFAAWEVRAALAHVRGDGTVVSELGAKIRPTLSRASYVEHYSDCPACTLVSLADQVDPATPPSKLEPMLAPLLAERPVLPGEDPRTAMLYDMLGVPAACDSARIMAPARLARAHARAGDRRRADEAIEAALRAMGETTGDRRLRVRVAELEVAGAARSPHVEALAPEVLRLARESEDVSLRLDACVTAHEALSRVSASASLRDELRSEALALAARLDARLEAPRHVHETRARTEP